MKSSEIIENLAHTSVGAICDMMAPSCVGCPNAKQFMSVDDSLEKDETKVKITVRCERMTLTGPVCPDGGEPGKTYLKDLGVPRRLGEQSLAKTTDLSGLELASSESPAIRRELRSPDCINYIKSVFKEQAIDNDFALHEMNETISFVANGELLDEPIIWSGEKPFETFSRAKEEYISKHVLPYKDHMVENTLLCEPTPYMEDNFPTKYKRYFGVMTEYSAGGRVIRERSKVATRDEFGNVTFIGDGSPPEPKTYDPPPTQDELYEDWGNFA